jgi:hypothetical protein
MQSNLDIEKYTQIEGATDFSHHTLLNKIAVK